MRALIMGCGGQYSGICPYPKPVHVPVGHVTSGIGRSAMVSLAYPDGSGHNARLQLPTSKRRSVQKELVMKREVLSFHEEESGILIFQFFSTTIEPRSKRDDDS